MPAPSAHRSRSPVGAAPPDPSGRARVPHGERGSIVPLVALIVLAAGGLAFALGRLGGAAVERAQARTAADAAALAGAVEGVDAAHDLAAANGGTVESVTTDGPDIEVVVVIGDARAPARARRSAPDAGGRTDARDGAGGGGTTAGLHPDLVAALREAERLLGRVIPITSGYRSPAMQLALWADRHRNPYPVARPGTSAHERGLAVDVPRAVAPALAAVSARTGLCRPLPISDPVHFELCRPSP